PRTRITATLWIQDRSGCSESRAAELLAMDGGCKGRSVLPNFKTSITADRFGDAAIRDDRKGISMRHLLTLEELERTAPPRLLARADRFRTEGAPRELLAGRPVLTLFFAP